MTDILLARNDGERYRPAYWLYQAFAFHLFGLSRTAHHLLQAGLTLAFVLFLELLTRRTEKRTLLVSLLPALFLIQSPLAENVYTLHKPDWLSALGLLGALTFGVKAVQQPQRATLWLGAASFCAAAALLSKESGLVALGTLCLIGLSGYVAGSWRRRGLLWWTAAAFAVFVGAYWLPSKYLIQPTVYRLTLADVSLRSMAFNGYTYLTKYSELFLLGAAVMVGLALERDKARRRDAGWLLAATAFLSGTAALALLIVWKWPCGYFLIPVNACWLAALILVADAFTRLSQPQRTAAAVVGVVWLLLNVIGFAQTARLQRACWRGFGMFVETYARQGEPGSRLFFPEQVAEAEVPIEANNQVKMLGGPQLGALAGAGAFALAGDPANQDLRPPTQGDYLALRRYEHAFGKHVRLFQDCATARLLPRLQALGWRLTPVGEYNFRMPNFVPGRDLGRTVVMEHALYRLDAAPPVRFALNGGLWRTDDWAGPELTLLVHQPGSLRIEGELPSEAPAPVTIRCLADGRTLHKQTLRPGEPLQWEANIPAIAPRQAVEVQLVADAAVPAEQLGLRPKGERLSWRLRRVTFMPSEDSQNHVRHRRHHDLRRRVY
ncbi:MAG: hypothetical protein NZ585_09155 [Chloracidobacterium sp.]|nr:hypothetical protein [Chloracidobacterium sp.]MDW8217983.1 hypothetical protein [Acidobacteriota bacterium]